MFVLCRVSICLWNITPKSNFETLICQKYGAHNGCQIHITREVGSNMNLQYQITTHLGTTGPMEDHKDHQDQNIPRILKSFHQKHNLPSPEKAYFSIHKRFSPFLNCSTSCDTIDCFWTSSRFNEKWGSPEISQGIPIHKNIKLLAVPIPNLLTGVMSTVDFWLYGRP